MLPVTPTSSGTRHYSGYSYKVSWSLMKRIKKNN
jgi:hypothetical protein